jgi:hypothetical protein
LGPNIGSPLPTKMEGRENGARFVSLVLSPFYLVNIYYIIISFTGYIYPARN